MASATLLERIDAGQPGEATLSTCGLSLGKQVSDQGSGLDNLNV